MSCYSENRFGRGLGRFFGIFASRRHFRHAAASFGAFHGTFARYEE
jgi:hypothetical protein